MGRAPCCDKANVKKGPWSPEEDAKLKDYIEKFGTGGNWIALPQKAGLKRCGKSCRLRWLNYLRPNIKHGEFSDDEDRIICSLYASIGSRWSIIAAQLPGRTDNDIKNYWNTKLKKKLMMGSIINHNNINNNIITPNIINNTIINPKKSILLNQNLHHNNNNNNPFLQYNHYPSSLSSPSSLLSHVLSPSPSSSYQCTSTPHYNNNNQLSSVTMSFGAEGCYNNNNMISSNLNTLILMQNQPEVKDNSTLLVFGDHQPSSCSSDGSCSVTQMINPVKVEDNQQQTHGNLNINAVHHHHPHPPEDQGIMSDNHHHRHHASNNPMDLLVDQKPASCISNNLELWGQNGQSGSLLDYGLEEIKQLISTSSYFDDTKADEKDSKVMYYY